MRTVLRWLGQGAVWGVVALILGVFSTSPSYTHLAPGDALIKLSFAHSAQHKGACHRRTAKEIAALPANMRRPFDCPRERLPVLVEVALDGRLVYRASLVPTGLSGDGPARVYRRFVVAAGRHRITVRMRDTDRAEGFDYEASAERVLAPGQNLAITFREATSTFAFL